MVRKTKSDKKDTICKRCGHKCLTPQKLREHLKRKNPCKSLQKQKEVASIQTPIQVPIQKANQQAESSSINTSNKEKPHVVIPTPVPEKKAPILGVDYITEEETKNWISPNARKSRERIKTWGARLQKQFERLEEITDEQERDQEFREQEELGTALKRRAIAVHRAKVSRSHPDNGSNI
ncbi:unnamed protein product [Rhizophagus irregularis]|nr:unnamed protein product [Rhizophagus irregularis]CAB4418564.1 unnamed protein product [Rhizophagus irregularis]